MVLGIKAWDSWFRVKSCLGFGLGLQDLGSRA